MSAAASSTDLHETLAPKVVQTQIIFMVLPTLALLVRFWSRWLGEGLWWDDWTCVLAWVFGVVLSIQAILWTHYGLGQHLTAIPPAISAQGFLVLYTAFHVFAVGTTIIKYSALLFYQRVLHEFESFHRVLWVAYALVTAWLLASWIAVIFNCRPVEKFWHQETPGECYNIHAFFIGTAVPDMVLDLFVLLLPLPFLWKVQMSWGKKAALSVAFVCGYLAAVPSLARVISTTTEAEGIKTDVTYAGIPDVIWCFLEIPIGVISLCVPSWFHLVQRGRAHGLRALFTRKNFAAYRPRQSRSVRRARNRGAWEESVVSSGESVVEVSGSQPGNEEHLFKDGVTVRTDISVTSEAIV